MKKREAAGRIGFPGTKGRRKDNEDVLISGTDEDLLYKNIELGRPDNSQSGQRQDLPPMSEEGVHAGFPSPATDYMNRCIDLNVELVKHPAATFYGRVVGDSMIDAGVEEGDILVIDKSLEAKEGDMAVCFIDGEFTLKYISFKNPETEGANNVIQAGKARSSFSILQHPEELWLIPANKAYRPIHVTEGNDFTVWGIVTYIIKKCHEE